MADFIRVCSFHTLRFSSSSVLASFSSRLSFPQLGLPRIQILDNKRIYPLAVASSFSSLAGLACVSFSPRKHLLSFKEFLGALSQAGDRLVIVEFYGTWCASCRALFPKLCKTAEEHPDILFLKVNFDENKPMCKSLNVKVLPYFHFYRGADGQLESFSCSLAKFQKIKDAIALHNTDRCSIGPPKGVGDGDLSLEAPLEKPAGSS